MINLNIGAGLTFIEEFYNIDISDNAEIKVDLSYEKLPFKESSVDLIFSYHCIEHIPNYLFALNEIFRVLKHGGIFLIGVPYVTLTEYNLVNPYHVTHFNEFSFDFFDTNKLKGTAIEDNSIHFKKIFHRFHYKGIFRLFPPFMKNICRRHLFNVVEKIDFGLIAVKNNGMTSEKIDPNHLIQKFDSCLQSRKPYSNL